VAAAAVHAAAAPAAAAPDAAAMGFGTAARRCCASI